MTATLTKDQAATLAKDLQLQQWTARLTLDDGRDVRAKLEYDEASSLEDSGDWFGTIKAGRRSDSSNDARPEGFNGAARKISSRGGMLWWQPPQDVLSDPSALASLEKRVRAYFLEDWTYVGVVVEVRSAPCSCCGERKAETQSLWGIESDAGDYFAEVLGELTAEASV